MQGNPSDLWHQIGKALWFVQLAEFSLVHYAVALRHPEKLTPAEVEALLSHQFKPTVGVLVGNLRAAGHLAPATDEALSHFVSERNWLAHRVRREHGTAINSPAAFRTLMARLEALESNSTVIAKQVANWLEAWAVSRGVSPAQLEAETQRVYAQTFGNET